MTQVEEIEKAAKAYTQKIIDSNSFEVNYEEDNYDAGSLHATSEICPMAFKAGAKWAEKHHAKKQSIWYNINDTPSENSEIVFMDIDGNVFNYTYSRNEDWGQVVETNEITIWAYLNDLANL